MCVIESEIGVCLPRKALDLATQKCKNQRAPKPSSNPHKGSKIAHITGLDCLYTYLCTMKSKHESCFEIGQQWSKTKFRAL